MKATVSPSEMIDVDDLRVGMHVHLDLGWMSHPFPLSSFKIASAEQVAVLRELGLQRVRWDPRRSDVEPIPPARLLDFAASAPQPLLDLLPGQTAAATAEAVRPDNADPADSGLVRCERQFAEAAGEARAMAESVTLKPQRAGHQAQALTASLLAKMLVSDEVCVRLLSQSAGDSATHHALNVAIIALLAGRSLGLSGQDMLDLGVGALMHDIGKIDIPERLRHLDAGATTSERRAYEEHVAFGVGYARRMGLSGGATLVIAQHHEHADGSGFPLRLRGDRMTLAARIVHIVDRYDNLCNPPQLAAALTPHEALSQLFAHRRAQCDGAVLGALIRLLGVYPPGSTVQLSDDRFALVVAVNSANPLKPCVLVHEPAAASPAERTIDLERSPALAIRRSVQRRALPAGAIESFDLRRRLAYFFEPGGPTADRE